MGIEIVIAGASFLLGYVGNAHFARAAKNDLEEATNKTVGTIEKIANAFAEIAEERGMVEWQRDEKGRITFYRIIRAQVVAAQPNVTLGLANLELSNKPTP